MLEDCWVYSLPMLSTSDLVHTGESLNLDATAQKLYQQEKISGWDMVTFGFVFGPIVIGFFIFPIAIELHARNASLYFHVMTLFFPTLVLYGVYRFYQALRSYVDVRKRLAERPEDYRAVKAAVTRIPMGGFDPKANKRRKVFWETSEGATGSSLLARGSRAAVGDELWVALPKSGDGEAVGLGLVGGGGAS